MIENLLRYMCATNCRNRISFDKVIAKIKRCSFFASHGSCICKVRWRGERIVGDDVDAVLPADGCGVSAGGDVGGLGRPAGKKAQDS